MRSFVILASLVVLLTGCSADGSASSSSDGNGHSQSATATPSSNPSLNPGDAATIQSLTTLVRAAGIPCDSWNQDDAIPDAEGSGWCTPESVGISTYTTTAARDHVLQLNEESLEPGQFLVGSNWLIGRGYSDIEFVKLRELAGGDFWPSSWDGS